MSSNKQKIIKITQEGLRNNYIENYSDPQNWTPELFSKLIKFSAYYINLLLFLHSFPTPYISFKIP